MAKKDANEHTIVPIRPKLKCSVPLFKQRSKRQKTVIKEEMNKNKSLSNETKKIEAVKK